MLRSQMTVLVCLSALMIAPAAAQDVRFPETGDPAFELQMPDDWTSRPIGSLLQLESPDGGESFSLGFVAFSGALDDFAADQLNRSNVKREPLTSAATIGPYSGTAYFATMTNDDGDLLSMKFVAVRIDDETIASCVNIWSMDATEEETDASLDIANSMTLTKP